jgi:hypothetical protein
MGSSSGPMQPVQQTAATREPWGPSQPYLQQAMQSAQGYFTNNYGYVPYTGQTQADVNPWTQLGVGTAANIAGNELGGSVGVNAARDLGLNMIQNQGLNEGLRTAAGQFGDIYSRALGDENPYLQGAINQQVNRVNSGMSGAGRYGSGVHDAAVAAAAAPILAEDYNRRQQLQMQATGAMGDIYGQGLNRAGQYSQLIPTLDEARYQPASHLAAAGQFWSDRQQAALNDQLKTYNAQQAYPWEQLARYNAIVQGTGGLGGSQLTTASQPAPSTMQRIFGGALTGAGMGSMFGAPGMAAGALGGGLLGMM